MTSLKCIVCNKPTTTVCSSICGAPISHAYCKECLNLGREDWTTLISKGFGLTRETAADWFHDLVITSCTYYHKSESEFWQEVAKLEVDYEMEMKFKGDPNKMAPKDYTQYHSFTHDDNCDGDVSIVAEIICVHTFFSEKLDVFHPIYDVAPTSNTITKAFVSHTGVANPTIYEFIEAHNFRALVDKWIARFPDSCQEQIKNIVYKNYAFLQYLE